MIKRFFILYIGIVILFSACGDKTEYLQFGPGYKEGSSLYKFYNKWGKDYRDGPGPGYGDGTSASDPGGFKAPTGIFIKNVNGQEIVYVVDTGNNRVERFTTEGDIIGFTALGSAVLGSEGNADGKFENPVGICINSSNQILVADEYNGRIQKFDNDGNFLLKIGNYTNFTFSHPVGVAVDNNNNIYVCDSVSNNIKKFTSAGTLITSWGGLNNPYDIEINNGEVYVSDSGNHRIVVFDTSGNKKRVIGSFGYTVTKLNQPEGIAVDNNYIYVVDGNYIKIFNKSSGTFVTYLGGLRGKGDGEFYNPSDVAVDSSGNIYITDTYNNRIQIFKKE